MGNNDKFGSGEYTATPSHCLPAFVGGKPSGYMCMACGHLTKELDPVFEDLCLICLKEWAIKQGVSRMIPTAEAIAQKEALEPTAKVTNVSTTMRERANAPTVIIKRK
jgi:hypothetical protein